MKSIKWRVFTILALVVRERLRARATQRQTTRLRLAHRPNARHDRPPRADQHGARPARRRAPRARDRSVRGSRRRLCRRDPSRRTRRPHAHRRVRDDGARRADRGQLPARSSSCRARPIPRARKSIVERTAFLEFRITDAKDQFRLALPSIDAALRRAGVTGASVAGARRRTDVVSGLLGRDSANARPTIPVCRRARRTVLAADPGGCRASSRRGREAPASSA